MTKTANQWCIGLAVAGLLTVACSESSDSGAPSAAADTTAAADTADSSESEAPEPDSTEVDSGPSIPEPPAVAVEIPLEVEHRLGDAEAGWDYLRYGDYIGSGVPYALFAGLIESDDANHLEREGDSATLSAAYNTWESYNGVQVAAGTTCMGCHSSFINGAFFPGIGNTFYDLSGFDDGEFWGEALDLLVSLYGEDAPETEVSKVFIRGAQALGGQVETPFRGPNSAMRFEVAAARHRNPADLTWTEEPLFDEKPSLLASDVPPLWNVKKKHGLYYTGMGRGDFARLIMQIGVVAIVDADMAESIDEHAPDLLAWIFSLEPPAYPADIDAELAQAGAAVFLQNCASCHGTYGEEETYPNLWIPADYVGTDPEYARYFVEHEEFVGWFNASWYAQDGTYVLPEVGYVAPPLDGVWATAPYLHNGSVPTLAALLDSSTRPERWLRNFVSSNYDFEAVGWPYEVVTYTLPEVYDTTVLGFSNQGHIFGDALSTEDRTALLEYLKTL